MVMTAEASNGLGRDALNDVARIGRIVAQAIRSRQILMHELRQIDDTRESLARAGRMAHACGQGFDDARWALTNAPSSIGLDYCVERLLAWLDVHVDACDALALAAGTGDRVHLSSAMDKLRTAQMLAKSFNAARDHLARHLAA